MRPAWPPSRFGMGWHPWCDGTACFCCGQSVRDDVADVSIARSASFLLDLGDSRGRGGQVAEAPASSLQQFYFVLGGLLGENSARLSLSSGNFGLSWLFPKVKLVTEAGGGRAVLLLLAVCCCRGGDLRRRLSFHSFLLYPFPVQPYAPLLLRYSSTSYRPAFSSNGLLLLLFLSSASIFVASLLWFVFLDSL